MLVKGKSFGSQLGQCSVSQRTRSRVNAGCARLGADTQVVPVRVRTRPKVSDHTQSWPSGATFFLKEFRWKPQARRTRRTSSLLTATPRSLACFINEAAMELAMRRRRQMTSLESSSGQMAGGRAHFGRSTGHSLTAGLFLTWPFGTAWPSGTTGSSGSGSSGSTTFGGSLTALWRDTGLKISVSRSFLWSRFRRLGSRLPHLISSSASV
mmetsp:Transcript_24344/g.54233  ORF Transcript_24344/g.54233 Transcript_24344/m.54233 type:complete len:210 (+) Transcript_24344:427-1056(+)